MAIIDKPTDYFDTVIYSGNGGTQSITSLDFQPDMVWGKGRTLSGYNHGVVDSVRGVSKLIYPNLNEAEGTYSTGITSFNSDGFSVGSGNVFNNGSNTYVAWNWKAGTSFTNDASATGIGTIDSAGSSNQEAGFSIVSYTGTGSAGTVAHGLGAVPKMIIIKSRNTVSLWGVYHQAIGNTHGLFLNATNAATDLGAYWNDTSPTSSVFSLGGDADINKSSDPLIAYCFADVQGYSKFSSYIGNGNADGTFIYTGFSPAFIIVKSSSIAQNWRIIDNKRDSFNVSDARLKANTSAAEDTNTQLDFTSNGFKFRASGGDLNASGQSYIYMAFASEPFTTSTGVPACAR